MSVKNNNRISFSSAKNQYQYPDFLEIQVKSFEEFFQLNSTPEKRKMEGLHRVFQENFPISDTRNNFVLEFIDYFVDPPRYVLHVMSLDVIINQSRCSERRLGCRAPDRPLIACARLLLLSR